MPTEARPGARIAHIGIAASAVDDVLPFYRDILGLSVAPSEHADGARIVELSSGDGGHEIELLEPARSDSPIARFLAKRGPGIHHICFAVTDLPAVLDRCRNAGIRLIDESPRIGARGRRVAFLHPSSTNGVLVELTQAAP